MGRWALPINTGKPVDSMKVQDEPGLWQRPQCYGKTSGLKREFYLDV